MALKSTSNKTMESLCALTRVLPSLILFCAVACSSAHAQGFAALVSPPRFELTVKPGEHLHEVLEISNAGAQSAKFRVKTADWSLDKNAGVAFHESLQPGSCRPWVAIERRDITVPAGGKYRYRFEVAPPTEAPSGECRFALLIEGDEEKVQASNALAFPIAGRIGVIVYVGVGTNEPRLEIAGTEVGQVNGKVVPLLVIKNTGNAHGRLTGFLSGTDASGQKLEFTPSTLPILPGETRAIALVASEERDEPAIIAYPITIRGNLEWADKTMPFEQRFAP